MDNTRKNLSSETMRYYRENLSRFICWLEQRNVTKASKITKELIDDFFMCLAQTVANRTSVNTYMRAVRRFINFLAEQRVIKPIRFELLKDSNKIKPTFNSKETSIILNSVRANDDTSVIMLVLLSVGIRSRSLCELRVQDIDFDDGFIDIQRTKNGVPLRLPISKDVADVLKEYVAIYKRENLLFLSVRGNKFNRDSLVKRIKMRLQELGIQKNKRGVHIFRHTFGKIMSMNSCPATILQKWFGHSDIRITQRYVDLYGNDLKNTMNMIPTNGFQYCQI